MTNPLSGLAGVAELPGAGAGLTWLRNNALERERLHLAAEDRKDKAEAENVELITKLQDNLELLHAASAVNDALLAHGGAEPGLVVHHQRFMVVDDDRVPDERDLPDPGLRRAEPDDIPVLAELAVQLHVDDQFGPHPGRAGLRGYRQRLEETVRQGQVWCVGPVGAPVLKLERSVSSVRFGVQLAGIVVNPEERNRGIGRAAVAAAVRSALRDVGRRPVTLHVRADNLSAQRAYVAAGFVDREEWRLAVRS